MYLGLHHYLPDLCLGTRSSERMITEFMEENVYKIEERFLKSTLGMLQNNVKMEDTAYSLYSLCSWCWLT